MKSELSPQHPLRKLFAGLVEHVFMVDVGICDPALTDYVGALLADFVHVDRIYRLHAVDGEVIRDLSRMEAEADLGPDIPHTARQRLVNKYIGDFTLFWAGVYPEFLRPRHQGGVDGLHRYLLQGKHSYGVASELTRPDDDPPRELLLHLSDQFEYCVHGLQLVRAGWERLGESAGN